MTGGERGSEKKRWTRSGALARALALGVLLGVGVAATAACEKGGRFPVCKTHADCVAAQTGAGSVCYNLRCVECRYDTDCPAGGVCNSANECRPLSAGAPAEKNEGAVKWDPVSWDDCAKACNDEACVKKCNQRFER